MRRFSWLERLGVGRSSPYATHRRNRVLSKIAATYVDQTLGVTISIRASQAAPMGEPNSPLAVSVMRAGRHILRERIVRTAQECHELATALGEELLPGEVVAERGMFVFSMDAVLRDFSF